MPKRIIHPCIFQAMKGRELMAALIARDGRRLAAVAKIARGSQPQLYRYVNGLAAEPRRDTLRPFARYFGVDLEAFYNPELARVVASERGLLPAGTPVAAQQAPPTQSATVIPISDMPISAIGLEVARKLSRLSEDNQKLMAPMILAALEALPEDNEGPVASASAGPRKPRKS